MTILIPAHNEEKNLPSVLKAMPDLPEIAEVVLVDGRSNDKTVEVATRLLPDIKIVRQEGSGKGDAIICGARAAVAEWFLVLDADGSQLPQEIPAYIAKAKEGYDLVKGSRYMSGGYSEEDTWDRRLATGLAQFTANRMWRTSFTDICYGMFLVNRDKFLQLDIRSARHDVEWEMMAKAAMRRLKIAEVPAYEAKRISGRSHVSYVRDGWLIAKTVFRQSLTMLGRRR